MADSLTKVEMDFKCKATMTKDLGLDGVTDPSITVETATDTKETLTSSTTPPVTKVWSDTRSFTTSETLDLTALPEANFSSDVDFTGLKVQVVKITTASSNTGAITFADGATNGYNLFGAATGQVTLPAKSYLMMRFNDTLDDVGASDLAIDVTGTGTLSYDIELIAG